MKNIFKYCMAVGVSLTLISACKRDNEFMVVGTPGGFISNYQFIKVYSGADVKITSDLVKGSNSIRGVVVSDQTGGNMPDGVVIIQSKEHIGSVENTERGIAVEADASLYQLGDSLHVNVIGATFGRKNGILQLSNLSASAIEKMGSGRSVSPLSIGLKELNDNFSLYENTLVVVSHTVTDPVPMPNEKFSGEKTIDDGGGKVTLNTLSSASFANELLPVRAHFTALVLSRSDNKKIELRMRKLSDFIFAPEFIPSPLIITGHLSNPNSNDAVAGEGAWEYVQLMATRDIDFSVTPMALVTTNNAGQTVGPPLGWATGGNRTYKFDITSGTAKKGETLYVGGHSKLIWGRNSTDISSANWVVARNYVDLAGNGFGTKSANLLANSGNITGISVFNTTTVDSAAVPMDVVMFGGGNPTAGNVYKDGPPMLGFKITNNDLYSTINPASGKLQPFYGQGTNAIPNNQRFRFPDPMDSGNSGAAFIAFSGEYNPVNGRWLQKREANSISMTRESTLEDIENPEFLTKLKN